MLDARMTEFFLVELHIAATWLDETHFAKRFPDEYPHLAENEAENVAKHSLAENAFGRRSI